jgi:hypothetical protein
MMDEITFTREIPNFPDYEITKDGRVWSKTRLIPSKGGSFRKQPGRWLKPGSNPDGYTCFILCKDTFKYPKSGHRLVAETFIANPESKPQVNHKNGIRFDNRVENLEWVTLSEQQRHAIDVLGKKPAGMCSKGHKNAQKIPEHIAREIRNKTNWKHGEKSALARKLGVHPSSVIECSNGNTWVNL